MTQVVDRTPDGHPIVQDRCAGCGGRVNFPEGRPPLCVRGKLVEQDGSAPQHG